MHMACQLIGYIQSPLRPKRPKFPDFKIPKDPGSPIPPRPQGSKFPIPKNPNLGNPNPNCLNKTKIPIFCRSAMEDYSTRRYLRAWLSDSRRGKCMEGFAHCSSLSSRKHGRPLGPRQRIWDQLWIPCSHSEASFRSR